MPDARREYGSRSLAGRVLATVTRLRRIPAIGAGAVLAAFALATGQPNAQSQAQPTTQSTEPSTASPTTQTVIPPSSPPRKLPPPQATMPLHFVSEIVQLRVAADTLHVEGRYLFLCEPYRMPFITLFCPYPEDSLLGPAVTTSLECTVVNVPEWGWQDLRFGDETGPAGSRWWVPTHLGDSLEVRLRYRQPLRESYARYALAAPRSWRTGAVRTRLEVELPPGSRDARFDLPFERHTAAGRTVYICEVDAFEPTRDLIIRWSP